MAGRAAGLYETAPVDLNGSLLWDLAHHHHHHHRVACLVLDVAVPTRVLQA